MPVSKIKIVDVEVNDEEIIHKDLEDNEKTYNDIYKKDIEVDEEIEEEIDEQPEVKKKERIQQLEECERCGKMLTKKSLKYNHYKYCGVDKEDKPKSKIVKQPVPKTIVEQPKSVPELLKAIPPPTLHKSFEDLRRERMIQRMGDKRESARQLFLHAV